MMDIPFQGKYEKKHVDFAFRELSKPSLKKKIYSYGVLAIMLVALGGIGYSMITSGEANDSHWTKYIKLLIALAFFVYAMFRPLINNRKKANQHWQVMQVLGIVSGQVDDLGITLNTVLEKDSRAAWTEFIKKAVSDEVIALVDAKGEAVILAKTFFESDKDWRRVNEMVEYKVKEIIS